MSHNRKSALTLNKHKRISPLQSAPTPVQISKTPIDGTSENSAIFVVCVGIVNNFLIIAFECVLTKSLKSFGAQDWGPCLDYNAHIYDFEYVLAEIVHWACTPVQKSIIGGKYNSTELIRSRAEKKYNVEERAEAVE